MASPTSEHRPSTKSADDEKSPPRSATPNQSHDTKSPPKRKNSESAAAAAGSEHNPENGKKKRRKVNHACVYCRRSHMTCDLERPCTRCIKRDIGHLCHDEPRDPPKRSKSDVGVPEIAPAPGDGAETTTIATTATTASTTAAKRDIPAPPPPPPPPPPSHRGPYAQGNGDNNNVKKPGSAGGPPSMGQSLPLSPSQLQRPTPTSAASNGSTFLQNFDWNNSNAVHSQFQDMHHLHPNYMFNTSEATNEYNLLNDFLSSSLLDDGGLYADDAQALFSDPLLTTSSMNALALSLPPSATHNYHPSPPSSSLNPSGPTLTSHAGAEISRPSSTFPIDSRARDKFYMTAADPAGLSSAEDRLHKLLKAKYDAGMLRPFNHVKGYARLNAYMSAHLSSSSQRRIRTQLDRFRPKFREAMQSLTDMQLVLVEMWFERSLMGLDRVFAAMAIPACCWRRTGEIFRGNTEMAGLIKCPLEALRDGQLAIHEIIAEDSLVSYWEKFGAIAFDNSQKAILTSCALMLPEAREARKGTAGVGTQQQTSPQKGQGQAQTTPQGPPQQGPLPLTNGEKNGVGTTNGASGPAKGTIKCCFSFTIKRDSHNIPSLIVGNFLPIQQHPL